MVNFKCLDLFAGAGGMALGFEKNGFETVLANDIDGYAHLIYTKNFKNTKFILGDIKEIDSSEIPHYDVFLAGFPCQPFSVAGYRQGFNDEQGRGNLFFEITRILKETRPRAFLLENVKNLQSHDNGKTFRIICEALTDLGYHSQFKIIDCMNYGNLPQTRERIYIVGFKNIENLNCFSFPEKKLSTKSFRDFLENDVDEKYYYTQNSYPIIYPKIKDQIKSDKTVYQWRRKYVRENKNCVCPTLTANMGTGGHNVPLILDNKRIRKLTPRECFNLQGFPKSFSLTDKLSDTSLYKIAGNSVPVPVIFRIAKNIKLSLQNIKTGTYLQQRII